MHHSAFICIYKYASITIFYFRLISSPISLHWLWPIADSEMIGADIDKKQQFIEEKSTQMCHDW